MGYNQIINKKKKVVNCLIKVQKRTYKLAKTFGFQPQNDVSHSVSYNNYYLTDSDYSKMLRSLQKKVIDNK